MNTVKRNKKKNSETSSIGITLEDRGLSDLPQFHFFLKKKKIVKTVKKKIGPKYISCDSKKKKISKKRKKIVTKFTLKNN